LSITNLTVYRHLSCCIWHRELNDGLQRADKMFQSYTRSDVIIFWWWSWDVQRGLHRQQREIMSLSRLKRKLWIGFNHRAFTRLRRITFCEFHILTSLWKGIIDLKGRRERGKLENVRRRGKRASHASRPSKLRGIV